MPTTPSDVAPRERIIVALDMPTVDDARAMVRQLGDSIGFYKVGLELVMSGGLDLVRELKTDGLRVFLDVKFLDIGNQVQRAVAAAARSGADFLTVHATDSKTLAAAAAAGAEGTGLKVLGVTVMTNLGAEDLAEQRVALRPQDLVAHRAGLVAESGCHGVIASGQEAAAVRAILGPEKLVVTPGIRMTDDVAGDQLRITTPQQAIADGADYLVVGRPITGAKDPKAAADRFANAIADTAN
ncbi:MAG: orotidine-5'-phosphate decarboxylase [Pseudomonadota bacterium]